MEDNDFMEDIFHMDVCQGNAISIYKQAMGKGTQQICRQEIKRLHLSLTQKLLGIIFKPQIPQAGWPSKFNQFWTWYNSIYKII